MPRNTGADPAGWLVAPSSLDKAGQTAGGGLGGLVAKVKPPPENRAAGALCDDAREAASNARALRCPRSKQVSYAIDQETRRAFAVPCGSWACSWCGWRKRAAAAYMVQQGINLAAERGERIRFMTLTESPAYPFETAADVSKAWNRFRTRLRKSGDLREYAAAVELTQAGRPHLHIVATGEYIPQARLSEYAAGAGFGPVADIRAIKLTGADDDKRTAGYIAKELAQYVSKSGKARAADPSEGRARPIRTSRRWYPGGLRKAEQILTDHYRPDDVKTGAEYWHLFARDLSAGIRLQGRDDLGGFILRQSGPGEAASIARIVDSSRESGAFAPASGEEEAPAIDAAAKGAKNEAKRAS